MPLPAAIANRFSGREIGADIGRPASVGAGGLA